MRELDLNYQAECALTQLGMLCTQRHLFDRFPPFGLDCREPSRAVSVVWQLASIMRDQIEPHLRGADSGWSWDNLIYQHLANTLEVLGLNDEGEDIKAIPATARRTPCPTLQWSVGAR